MDYALGLQDDFELRDDLQIVSLYNPVTSVTTSNVKSVNLRLSWREVILGAPLGIQATDQNWRLGCKSLKGVTPNVGDYIISADNTTWTIIFVDLLSFSDTPIYFLATARKQ